MKQLTSKQAFSVLAFWFDYYARTGRHVTIFLETMKKDFVATHMGICRGLYLLMFLSLLDTTNQEICDNLLHDCSSVRTGYFWPPTRGFAAMRAKLCRELAAQTVSAQ